jgi:fumarate hydratase class II
MPVLINAFLQSVTLLSDVMISFEKNCLCGIKANKQKMKTNLYNSLMLVTALTPHIGYENAAKVVHLAHEAGLSLKEATVKLGFLSNDKFDELFHPEEMV